MLANRYGNRKLAIAIGCILVVLSLQLIYPELIQRLLFTKNDARNLLAIQDLDIQHDFQVVGNEYKQWTQPSHRLTLDVDVRDRTSLAEQIRNSPKFTKKIDSMRDIRLADRYFGDTIIVNYETKNALISKSLIPAQKDNYAPMWSMVSISKTDNKLEVVRWYDD